MRRIKDPVEKIEVRRSITRILYDAQEGSMSKTQQMATHSQGLPSQPTLSHLVKACNTTPANFLHYHEPPATSTPPPPPGNFTGNSDQQGEDEECVLISSTTSTTYSFFCWCMFMIVLLR